MRSTEFRRIWSHLIYLKLNYNLRRRRRKFGQRSIEISWPAGLGLGFSIDLGLGLLIGGC